MGQTSIRKLMMVARVANQQLGRSRRYGSLKTAFGTTAKHLRRVLGQLWLEVTGFVFLCLAGIGAIALLREYLKYQSGHTTSGRVALAAGFTLLFGWFGVSSFWRIRSKQ
jgi:hypothetical protein